MQTTLSQKIGILGAGQLGKMLCQAASPWHLDVAVLDTSPTHSAVPYATRFVQGDFNDYATVMSFGQTVDVLTIEIEHVNIEALLALQQEGKIIHPRPQALAIIKDKGLQKQFYQQQGLPSGEFSLYPDAEAIRTAVAAGQLTLPFVQKARTGGYDGKGVQIVRTPADLSDLLPVPSVVESMVDIDKEIAVIVARNENGETAIYEPVAMQMNPTANLVERLVMPATLSPTVREKAFAIAKATIAAYDICGLLAIEFFVTPTGDVLINEVAPRPHNSGHATIEACLTSQFEQHLRGILNLPLGSTRQLLPALMLNVLGAAGHRGIAHYEGFEDCVAQAGVHVHLYGKTHTTPQRKMGHITIVADSIAELSAKADWVSKTLMVKAIGE